MKKFLFTLLGAAGTILVSCSQREQVVADYNVVPLPHSISLQDNNEGFVLKKNTKIVYTTPELRKEAEFAAEYLGRLINADIKISDKAGKDDIELYLGLESENPEAYKITVDKDLIRIDGASPAAVFYAIQTLRKSIPDGGEHNVLYPSAEITDEPEFAYRGAHLDVSRHFFPADSVKTYLDMMAMHNMNTFHWHLTDDQGWRIEVPKYPRLTEVGSKRPRSVIGRNTPEYDSIPVEGFYTDEEIRDIVDYAAKRHITIIPEIDLPGHMQAALASYPELGCTGGPYKVWEKWGISDDVLCAGNDSVYTFLTDVMDVIIDLFPAEYVHIGGDECPKVRWENCPKCQARIKELGIKKDKDHSAEDYLQSSVMIFVQDYLAKKGRKIIGWDEIMDGKLAPGATIMSWRGEKSGLEAARQGYDAIMTPCTYLYFDYYQKENFENEPLAMGAWNPLPIEKVYSYNPIPEGMSAEERAHILGVQANMWTEYVPTFSHVQYMTLPRWAALSELQWNNQSRKDLPSFLDRTKRLTKHYDNEGYNYCRIIFENDSVSSQNN